MSTQAIKEVITAALAQEAGKDNPERRSVPWDNGMERFLVVNLPLDQLRLNPNSHRIKAQLLARPDHEKLLDDPFTDASQGVIAELLRGTEGFEDLKADLAERKQREPGAVTRKGVLVNANTRAVALRDLGETHIRAMVLPEEATQQQIAELELRLQVSRDYKQDYTYTNRLLFIKDCQEAGWTDERIGDEVHGTKLTAAKKSEKVRRDLRVLAMIDELIAMSGGKFSYPDFDEKAVALEELDRDYQAKKENDPTAAVKLRTARQVAILTGVGYRDIRAIDAAFVDDYLEEAVKEDDEIAFLLEAGQTDEDDEPDGVDLLGGNGDDGSDLADGLLNWLTQTAGDAEVSVPAGDTTRARERAEVVEAIQTAVEKAVADAKSANRRVDALTHPREEIRDAIKRIKGAEAAYTKVRTDTAFAAHAPKLRERIAEARRHLDSLSANLDAHHPAAEA